MSRLVMSSGRYRRMVAELARRGGGTRESGAFLLASADAPAVLGRKEVVDVVYYDDVDPGSLTGGITIHAAGFAELNRRCQETQRVVVGDAHTHPSDSVRQSAIDAANPMLAFVGHTALIVPNFAAGSPRPSSLGAHRFLGRGRWESRFGRAGREHFLVASALRLTVARALVRLQRR